MKKTKTNKALVAALVTSAVVGGGTLTSHAAELDNAPANDQIPTNDVVENQDEDIPKVETTGETEEEKVEPAVGAEEEIQPINDAITTEEKTEEKVEEKAEEKVDEKAQPVNNEADKEKTEEKTEEKARPASNNEKTKEKVEEKTEEKATLKEDDKSEDEDSLEISDEEDKNSANASAPIQEDADQNIVNGLKLTNVDFIDANDSNKVITDLSNNYRVKMDFVVVGNIKEGDRLIFNMIMPEMADSSWKDAAVHDYKPFYMCHDSTPVDVNASINGKNICIGSLRDNAMIFNKNAELLNINSKLQLAFEVLSDSGSTYGIHSTSSTAQNYTLNFHTMLNGDILKVPFRKTIKVLPQRDYSWDGFGIGYTLGSYGQGEGLFDVCGVSLNASIGIAKEEGTGKNSVIKIRYELPEGLEFDAASTVRALGLFKSRGDWAVKDHNELSTIFADFSYANNSIKRINNSTVEQIITFNKDLPDYKGYTWEANAASLPNVIVNDKNILKRGHDGVYPLAKAIKATIFVNGKSTNTVTMDEATIKNIDSFGLGEGFDKPDEVTKTTKIINPGVEYIAASDKGIALGYNEKKTIKEGKAGKKEIVTTTSYKTGKPVATTKENIITPAENKVVAIGNKTAKAVQTPYKFVYVYDDNLQPGEFKVVTKGQKGQIITTTTYDVNASDGSLSNPKSSEKVIEAKNEIIHFGAGAKIPGVTIKTGDDTTKQSEEVAIPAKMFYEADPTLPYGTKKVVKKAIDGKKVYIGEFKVSADGIPTFKILEEKVIKPKQDGLTKVGNKKVETNEIPPLPGGSKPGTKTTTTIYDIDPNTGEESNPKVTTKISYPAEKIQDTAKTTKVTKEDIPFNTIYKKDDKLKYNEKKVIQKGVKGENKVTTITQTGKKPIVNKELIKKPIDEIITIGNVRIIVEDVPPIKGGSKPGKKTTITTWDVDPKTGKLINPKTTIKISYPMEDIQDIATKTTKDIADVDFEIIYEADPNLEYGKTQIKQDGKKGKKEITTISKVVDGKRIEEKSEKIIEEVVNKIISVGNKKVVKEDIDYKVIEKETDELEIGKSKIEKPGEKGTKEIITTSEVDPKTGKLINEKTEEVITKEPIDEIKLIGTKKVIPWTKIQDIAKPIEKEQPKEDGNGKAKEEPKAQPVRQAMVPIAQPNVQTGIESVNPAIVAALLSSVGLTITNKKKKED